MKKISTTFLPGVLWAIVVTILLILPGSAFPQDNWLSKIWFDKWVHIGLFAIMVTLWCLGLAKKKLNPQQLIQAFIITAVISLLYGIGMEYVQKYFVANRSFDTGDIIADAIGCVAGFFFSKSRYIKK